MRSNTSNQPYLKFLKKINFGGLKSIFFISSLSYFCFYFFVNIDQISFDINLDKTNPISRIKALVGKKEIIFILFVK